MNKVTGTFITAQLAVTAFLLTGVTKAQQRRGDERGVVSIEYLVLGAALIVLRR